MVNWQFWKRQPQAPKGSFAGLGETLKAKPSKLYTYHIGERVYDWPRKCDEYDKYYVNHPEVKSMVLSIAGRATAKGIFLEPRTTGKPDEDRPRWKEASDLCERLNVEVGMDKLLYETIIPLVKYGTVLWEKTWEPDVGLQLLPIVKDYRPVECDHYQVSKWEILEKGQHRRPPLILKRDRFAEFSWNVTSTSWPFGTSLLVGLGQTLAITEQLIDDIQGYLHNAAFPMGLMQIGDASDQPTPAQLASIHNTHKTAEPGHRFTVSYPIDYKVIGPATAETRILGEVLTYLQDRKVDGLMVAPISKQHQRTLASAEVMEDDTTIGVILPAQRLCKRVVERMVYRPYLMFREYSVKNVPSLSFLPPDEDRVEQAEYYLPLLAQGVITREAVARELGIDKEDVPLEWQPAFQQQGQSFDQKVKQTTGETVTQGGKSWTVTENT